MVNGDEELWKAVIHQAFKDLQNTEEKYFFEKAKKWFLNNSLDFRTVCDLANISSEKVVMAAKKIIRKRNVIMNTNELQIFNYENNNVRTIIKNGEAWWVLKDICDVLGISNHKNVSARLDKDEKGVQQMDSLGGAQNFTTINESGLYKVILRSDKSEAKKFQKWVVKKVLPSIRKHGIYATDDALENFLQNPETIEAIFKKLKNERQKNQILKNKLEAVKPKVIFADAVSASDDGILIGELAKILKGNGIDIGQNRLFAYLRELGFLMKKGKGNYNAPTQKAMNLGLFKIIETVIARSNGNIDIATTTKVTGKGQQYFINHFVTNIDILL